MSIRRRRDTRRTEPVTALRLAIDCLPVRTRRAMLTAVRGGERIIVGAYVDREGGMCPMMAAHRGGGRTDLLAFAKSWDRFARASRKNPREATARELAVLARQLEASLHEEAHTDFAAAIADHGRLTSRHAGAREADPRGPIRAYRLSPGRRNMISGTRQVGEVFSR
jgi:hypothetical protein